MAMRGRSDATPRARLTRERVLGIAVELADEGGIDAVSMRRIAARLGVEAMSLYHHVPGKEAILSGLVEVVVGRFQLPADSNNWKSALRRTAMSAYDELLRHPWAAHLLLSPSGVGPARMRYMDGILGCLRRAGFTADMTHHAYHALDSHILGFTLWVVGIETEARRFPNLAATFRAELPSAEFPHLAEHVDQHLLPRTGDEPTEFEFGLDLILDGLERLLAASGATDATGGRLA